MPLRSLAALIASLGLGACQTPSSGNPGTVDCDGDPLCAPLTARGQEPGWLLELGENRIDLQYQYGEHRYRADTPRPETIDNGLRYQTENSRGQRLQVDLTRQYCTDSMSGMPYPYTARVQIDEQALDGCAGDPQQLLVDPTWVVEDVNGEGIVDNSRLTLRFTEDRKVHGLAGCNRYSGRYRLTGEGLRIDRLTQTRKACAPALMHQEEKLLKTLADVRRFRIDETGALRLKAGADRHLKAYRN